MTDTGSPTDANASDNSAESFPLRLRVHALARLLGVTSREVLAHLQELGVTARSASSSIGRDDAQAVADRLTGESGDSEEAAAPTVPPGPPAPPSPSPAGDESSETGPSVTAPVAETLFSALVVEEPTVAPEVPAEVAPLFLPPTVPEAPVEATTPESAAQEDIAPDTGITTAPQASDAAATDKRSKAGSTDVAVPDSADADASSTDAGDTDAEKTDEESTDGDVGTDESGSDGPSRNRRRRRGRRGRGRGRGDAAELDAENEDGAADAPAERDAAADRASDAPSRQSERTDGAEDGDAVREAESGNSAADDGEAQDREGKDGDGTDGDESGDDPATPTSKRRRRRRRRKGGGDAEDASPDDPPNTVVHEREPRAKKVRDEVQGISGSTRLEAKRQRRRDGRDAGRRRPPILSESEFLARREAVERVMVVRERVVDPSVADPHAPKEDYTQVAVLEDGVLVEHFVTTETSQSMVGNIYLGRVQNVLPGMEAAFVDIGRGRNGVLYAGEVNWEAAGLDGGSRKIEQALKPGDSVLVQVSKDPVGHKGARLTTQISLAGRYLVYVPGGTSTGISRKLPDTERKRLKAILAKLVPNEAGVIIRTASEGVSAEELGADIARLEEQWKGIEAAAAEHTAKASGTTRALYEEPDLLVRVVRDLFNEDFSKLVVEGGKAWDQVSGYVDSVAPDLAERVTRFEKDAPGSADSFGVYRIDEQLTKALDRKVWLPSGGTLIIEHTEAMTVVDVNTGKFTGAGGNLEETVTRNNLEAAEEIVRQMRLRDIGGMIIVDFIDMVLESNRDLVLRRLTEALARDRTRHQVSEVTSLGLVQMTRKRLGTGLLEAFSTTCTACSGRGLIVHPNPVEVRSGDDSGRGGDGGSKRARRNKRKADRDKPDSVADRSETPVAEAKSHKPAAEHPLFKAMAHHDDEAPNGGDAQETVRIEASSIGASVIEAPQSDAAVSEAPVAEAPVSDAAVAESAAVEVVVESVAVTEVSSAGGGAVAPKTAEVEVSAREGAVSEIAVAERDAAAAIQEGAQAAPVATRRRRAARRASSPSVPAEPIVVTTETPVTTVAAQTAEPVVEVTRKPRRRSGRRASGPPPTEQ